MAQRPSQLALLGFKKCSLHRRSVLASLAGVHGRIVLDALGRRAHRGIQLLRPQLNRALCWPGPAQVCAPSKQAARWQPVNLATSQVVPHPDRGGSQDVRARLWSRHVHAMAWPRISCGLQLQQLLPAP